MDALAVAKEAGVVGRRVRVALADAFLWAARRTLEIGREENAEPGAEVERRRPEIVHHMEEHSGRVVTRDQTAAAFGMTGGNLTRLFRRAGAAGFQETLLSLRLARAGRLLRKNALSVEEVALGCGFTSADYFGQAFRRVEGISPRAWRFRHGAR